jgi:hypothetical protein
MHITVAGPSILKNNINRSQSDEIDVYMKWKESLQPQFILQEQMITTAITPEVITNNLIYLQFFYWLYIENKSLGLETDRGNVVNATARLQLCLRMLSHCFNPSTNPLHNLYCLELDHLHTELLNIQKSLVQKKIPRSYSEESSRATTQQTGARQESGQTTPRQTFLATAEQSPSTTPQRDGEKRAIITYGQYSMFHTTKSTEYSSTRQQSSISEGDDDSSRATTPPPTARQESGASTAEKSNFFTSKLNQDTMPSEQQFLEVMEPVDHSQYMEGFIRRSLDYIDQQSNRLAP